MGKILFERHLSAGLVKRKVARASDHRQEARHGYRAGTGVLRFRDGEHVVSVHNISAHGATVGIDITLQIGEAVELFLRKHGYVTASACWVKNDRIGLKFDARMARLA